MSKIQTPGDSQMISKVNDGMRIDWDVPLTMDDGIVLRADIYRPDDDGQYPVIISYGPYCKWLAWEDGYSYQWQQMLDDYPDCLVGSSNRYQNWELVDPEKWVNSAGLKNAIPSPTQEPDWSKLRCRPVFMSRTPKFLNTSQSSAILITTPCWSTASTASRVLQSICLFTTLSFAK